MAKKAKLPSEVICLSGGDDNDDDDHVEGKKKEISVKNSTKQPEASTSVISKTSESSNWKIDDKDIIHISELPSKYSDIYTKPFEIRCTSIRFGLAEFNVDTATIFMKETEFEMKVIGGFSQSVNIKLSYSDIIAFYFSFQSEVPVALIQVRAEFAVLFDRYIPTADEHGRGFNPDSKDEKRKRVIFCLKSLTPDMERIHLSTIFYYLKKKSPKIDIRCISASRAQELYTLARYAKVPVPDPKTKLFTLNTNDLTAKTVGLNNNSIRFDLSSLDLHCLNEGEYLNDNIIDFYLQYIYYEKLTEDDRKRTYLFNSFFYTRLTQKNNRDNSTISAAERRYQRVKRWFRSVDLFSKDYCIVPINQNAHWYIVLIQNHNNVPTEGDLISDDDDYDPEDNELKTNKKKKRRSSRINYPRASKLNGSSSSTKSSSSCAIEFVDDADEVLSDGDVPLKIDIELLLDSTKRSRSPGIIIFDSLRIASKTRVAGTLREFLQLEYDQKKNLPIQSLTRKLFNMDTIPTIEADVPQQRNYCDCGLYILQYIESYFAHYSASKSFSSSSSSTFSDWCEKNLKGSTKRQEILNVINQHTIPKGEYHL